MKSIWFLAIAFQVLMTVPAVQATEDENEIATGVSLSETQPFESVTPKQCGNKEMTTGELADQPYAVRVQATTCPSGQATCRTFACGANGIYCCPGSHPYLSHCDCQCYNASPNCQSYSSCSR